MEWKAFLMPSLRKVIFSFLVALIWEGIRLLIIYLPSIIDPSSGIILTYPTSTFLLILSYVTGLIIETILFYPFACALYHLWVNRRSGETIKQITEKKVLFSIIIFNPVSITFILSYLSFLLLIYYYSQVLPSQSVTCGILIVDVFSGSPAEEAGLNPGIVLYKIDGNIIETIDEFDELMSSKRPGDTISINKLKNGSTTSGFIGDRFSIVLGENPLGNPERGYLGINLTQAFSYNGYECMTPSE